MTTNIKGSDSNSTAHQCSPCASLSLEPRSHFDPYCVCGWHLDLLHLHGDIRHLRKNPPRIQLHDEPGSVWCWCFSAAGEIGKKFENSALMGKPLNTAISVRRCRKAWPEGRSIGRGPWPALFHPTVTPGDTDLVAALQAICMNPFHEPRRADHWSEGWDFYNYWII